MLKGRGGGCFCTPNTLPRDCFNCCSQEEKQLLAMANEDVLGTKRALGKSLGPPASRASLVPFGGSLIIPKVYLDLGLLAL